MKINTTKKLTKKRLLVTAIIIFLVALALALYVYAFKGTLFGWSPISQASESSINYDEPTYEQKKSGETIKENSINPDNTSKPNVSGSDRSEPAIPQENGKSKVNATLTAANQNRSILQLRFDISTVTTTGTCTLTLKKSSSIVTKTAAVQALASSTTCKGFDVPTSELSAGTWQVAFHFENSDLVANTTGSAEVQ